MAIRSSGDEWCTRELNRPMGMREASELIDETGGGTGWADCDDGGLRPRVGVMIAWCCDGLMTLIIGLIPRSSLGLPSLLPTLLPPPTDDGPVTDCCICCCCCCCCDCGGGLVDTLLLRSLPEAADSTAAFEDSMIMVMCFSAPINVTLVCTTTAMCARRWLLNDSSYCVHTLCIYIRYTT